LTKPYEANELIALVKRAIASFTLDQMSEYVEQISRQDIAAQQAEVKRLQGLAPIGASDRLRLAYLLSLDNASRDTLVEAQAVLDGLEPLFGDPGTRLYVRLLQRTVMREVALDDLQETLRQVTKRELE
jgi:hypothetical protein